MRNGKINCNAESRTLSESDSALAIDADFAPGSVAGLYAMQKTIEKARAEGILLYDGVAGEISRTLHELNITESLDSVKK